MIPCFRQHTYICHICHGNTAPQTWRRSSTGILISLKSTNKKEPDTQSINWERVTKKLVKWIIYWQSSMISWFRQHTDICHGKYAPCAWRRTRFTTMWWSRGNVREVWMRRRLSTYANIINPIIMVLWDPTVLHPIHSPPRWWTLKFVCANWPSHSSTWNTLRSSRERVTEIVW